jgi:nucleotide-binding universal stress UspA family protein
MPQLKNVKSTVIESDSVVEGIVKGAKNYDAVMVGAAGKSIYPKILFGGIPVEIAKGVDKTVIVVKHFDPVKALVGRVVGE